MITKRRAISTGVFLAVAVGCAVAPYVATKLAHRADEAFAPGAGQDNRIVIATWNIRGYPEDNESDTRWIHKQLADMKADALCLQEIANADRVEVFLSDDKRFKRSAFLDSPDGQDNAIFVDEKIALDDIADPEGFQHPAQAAYISYKGFDAVVVSVHLSWTDKDMRKKEKALLKQVVADALKRDPDVIIVGDFNTTEKDIEPLARDIGMVVMVPASQDGQGTTHAGNRYDHFLISPDLANEEAVSAHIETFAGDDLAVAKQVSDHLPVVATFKTDDQFKDKTSP
jgi:endonuclease/exonuclease/phosphatase family metal-dependent hydrolase